MSNTKFDLWTPPVIDLSLDSFSNEIFQEFDKKRDIDGKTTSQSPPLQPAESHQNQIAASTNDNNIEKTNYAISASPISSSVTIPQSEREIEEETTSTTNLFRRSSTFLKNKLSLNSNAGDTSRNSMTSNLSSQQVEEISSIISRQYPPKPLQYSPIVDPPSDDIKITKTPSSSSGVIQQQEEKKASKDRTPNASKRRSFFSLRFC